MSNNLVLPIVRAVSGMSIVLAAATGSASACPRSIPSADSAAIMRLTAAQVIVDRLAAGLSVPNSFGPEHLSIECIDSIGPVRIYRIIPWILEHWHPYLVATSTIGVHPLGGFSAPDPVTIAAQAGLMAAPEDAERVALVLARFLDPNGSADVAFAPDSVASDELKIAWRRAARRGFPSDTTLRTSSAGTLVRVTMLSHRARQYPRAWQIVTVAMEFDSSGRLSAWAVRPGESSFAVEGPQRRR